MKEYIYTTNLLSPSEDENERREVSMGFVNAMYRYFTLPEDERVRTAILFDPENLPFKLVDTKEAGIDIKNLPDGYVDPGEFEVYSHIYFSSIPNFYAIREYVNAWFDKEEYKADGTATYPIQIDDKVYELANHRIYELKRLQAYRKPDPKHPDEIELGLYEDIHESYAFNRDFDTIMDENEEYNRR